MFSKVEIWGMGPHQKGTYELDPNGVTRIEGPSESGKTTLIRAALFGLWGKGLDGKPVDTGLVNGESMTVRLTTSSGNQIARKLEAKGRKMTRALIKNGEKSYADTEAEFWKLLGPLGSKMEVARMVMTPMSWVEMAAGPGGGRPLRDALVAILPGGDVDPVICSLMEEDGFEFSKDDPIDPQSAEDLRRETKSERDRSQGSYEAAQKALDAIPAVGDEAPDEAEITKAKAMIEANEAWREFDRKEELGKRELETRTKNRDRLDELLKNEPPKGDLSGHQKARAEVEKLNAEREGITSEPIIDDAEARKAEERALELTDRVTKMKEKGDRCPTCDQKWEDAAKELDRAEREAEFARCYVHQLNEEIERHRKKDEKERVDRLKKIDEQISKAEKGLMSDEEIARIGNRESWEREVGDLKKYFSNLDVSNASQYRPKMERPSGDEVAKAFLFLDAVKKGEGALDERRKSREAAASRITDAAIRLEELDREVARLESLVKAVRKAPSVVAEKQIGALGDMGPVELQFTDKGGVNVFIDGRPWYLASTGRRVYADAKFREAIRRVSRMPYVPIFVDDAGAWSGSFDVSGPVTLLYTAAE